MTSSDLTHQAISAFEAGDQAEARRLFTQASEADPTDTTPWLWLSCLATSDDEKRHYLERVLTLSRAATLNQQAIAAFQADERARALVLFQEVTQIAPNNQTAWLWCSCLTDSEAEQERCLERVLAINPDTSEGLRARVGLSVLRTSRDAALPTQPLPVTPPPPAHEPSDVPGTEPASPQSDRMETRRIPATAETTPSQNGMPVEADIPPQRMPSDTAASIPGPAPIPPATPEDAPQPSLPPPPDEQQLTPTETAASDPEAAPAPSAELVESESARMAREPGLPGLKLPDEYASFSDTALLDVPPVPAETDAPPDSSEPQNKPTTQKRVPLLVLGIGVVVVLLILGAVGIGFLLLSSPSSPAPPAPIAFGEDYQALEDGTFTLVNESAEFGPNGTVAFVASLDTPVQTNRVGLTLLHTAADGTEKSIFPADAGFDIADPNATVLAFRLPVPGMFQSGEYTLRVTDGERTLAEGQFTVLESQSYP